MQPNMKTSKASNKDSTSNGDGYNVSEGIAPMAANTNTKPIPVRLPIPLHQDVVREARKHKVSRSEIMRQLIREAMAARRYNKPHPKQ